MSYTQSWSSVLTSLLAGEHLSVADAAWAMDQVMTGEATDAQLAAFLIALRAKGETVDEIVGFRDAILDHAVPLEVDPMALDIVGTGGDRFGTVNVSTTASIVAAAAGIGACREKRETISAERIWSFCPGAMAAGMGRWRRQALKSITFSPIAFSSRAISIQEDCRRGPLPVSLSSRIFVIS